jgi:hypothetical protein
MATPRQFPLFVIAVRDVARGRAVLRITAWSRAVRMISETDNFCVNTST